VQESGVVDGKEKYHILRVMKSGWIRVGSDIRIVCYGEGSYEL